MKKEKYKELNEQQTEVVDLVSRYVGHIKKSNDYTSPSLPSDLRDELNSVFNYEDDKDTIVNSIVNSYIDLLDAIEKLQ